MKIFENMKKIQGDCKTIYQYYDKKKTKTKNNRKTNTIHKTQASQIE